MADPAEELQTTGWQMPDKSEWTMFIGIVEFVTVEKDTAIMRRPCLYLVRPDGREKLVLATFENVARAKIAITFITAMYELINKAIAHVEKGDPK